MGYGNKLFAGDSVKPIRMTLTEAGVYTWRGFFGGRYTIDRILVRVLESCGGNDLTLQIAGTSPVALIESGEIDLSAIELTPKDVCYTLSGPTEYGQLVATMTGGATGLIEIFVYYSAVESKCSYTALPLPDNFYDSLTGSGIAPVWSQTTHGGSWRQDETGTFGTTVNGHRSDLAPWTNTVTKIAVPVEPFTFESLIHVNLTLNASLAAMLVFWNTDNEFIKIAIGRESGSGLGFYQVGSNSGDWPRTQIDSNFDTIVDVWLYLRMRGSDTLLGYSLKPVTEVPASEDIVTVYEDDTTYGRGGAQVALGVLNVGSQQGGTIRFNEFYLNYLR
jgi:hypothetical protein